MAHWARFLLSFAVLLFTNGAFSELDSRDDSGHQLRRKRQATSILSSSTVVPTTQPVLTSNAQSLPNDNNSTKELSSNGFQQRSGLGEDINDYGNDFGGRVTASTDTDGRTQTLSRLTQRDQPENLIPFEDISFSESPVFERRRIIPASSSLPGEWQPNWPSDLVVPSPVAVNVDKPTPSQNSEQSVPSVFHFPNPTTVGIPVSKVPISQYYFDITDASVAPTRIPGPLHDPSSLSVTSIAFSKVSSLNSIRNSGILVTTANNQLQSSQSHNAVPTSVNSVTPSLSLNKGIEISRIYSSVFPVVHPTSTQQASTLQKSINTAVNNDISEDETPNLSTDLNDTASNRDISANSRGQQSNLPQYSLGSDSDIYLPGEDQELGVTQIIESHNLSPTPSLPSTSSVSHSFNSPSQSLRTNRPFSSRVRSNAASNSRNLIVHNTKQSEGETRKPLWMLLNKSETESSKSIVTTPVSKVQSFGSNDLPVGIFSNRVPAFPSSTPIFTQTISPSTSRINSGSNVESSSVFSDNDKSSIALEPSINSATPKSSTQLPNMGGKSNQTLETTNNWQPVDGGINSISTPSVLASTETVGVTSVLVNPEYSGGFTQLYGDQTPTETETSALTNISTTSVLSSTESTIPPLIGGFLPIAPSTNISFNSTASILPISSTPPNRNESQTDLLLEVPDTLITPTTIKHELTETPAASTFRSELPLETTTANTPVSSSFANSVVLGVTPKSSGEVGFDQPKSINISSFSTRSHAFSNSSITTERNYHRKPTTYVYPHELLLNSTEITTTVSDIDSDFTSTDAPLTHLPELEFIESTTRQSSALEDGELAEITTIIPSTSLDETEAFTTHSTESLPPEEASNEASTIGLKDHSISATTSRGMTPTPVLIPLTEYPDTSSEPTATSTQAEISERPTPEVISSPNTTPQSTSTNMVTEGTPSTTASNRLPSNIAAESTTEQSTTVSTSTESTSRESTASSTSTESTTSTTKESTTVSTSTESTTASSSSSTTTDHVQNVSTQTVATFNEDIISESDPYIKAVIKTSASDFCSHREFYEELFTTWLVENNAMRDAQNVTIEFFSEPNCDSSQLSNLTANETSVYFYVKKNDVIDSNLTKNFPLNPKSSVRGAAHQHLDASKVLQLELVQSSAGGISPGDGGSSLGLGVAGIVAIAVTSMLLITLVIAAVLFLIYRRKRAKANYYGKRCTPVSMDAYSVDSVSVYHSFRRKNKRNRSSRSVKSYLNQGFDDPNGPSRPVDFAQLTHFISDMDGVHEEFTTIPVVMPEYDEMPNNTQDKNRYANVIPVPETRVLLMGSSDSPEKQYINANYVKGPHNEKNYYIATQAPLDSTVGDFWRMVWEQETRVIVMITDFVEKGIDRCADYLPPSQTLDCVRVYGDFQVTLKSRDMQEKFVTSGVSLKNLENNLTRELSHMWFTGWPTAGVPNTEKPFISFVLAVRRAKKQFRAKSPIVVHCSPGTGRTGTFIATDHCMRHFEDDRVVNVPSTVYSIRRERAGAVQTSDQYAFIYRVVNLYASKLSSGNLDSL